jgi:hypothetical protein
MKEPYKQGIANQLDPKSCAGGRKVAGEALAGAHAGQPLSSEITFIGVPTSCCEGEGHTMTGANREPAADAAESQPLRMRRHSMRENRETPGPPLTDGGEGRRERAIRQASRMHVPGEWDDSILTQEYGLSLGDRSCLAAGIVMDAKVSTADTAWAKLNLGIEIHLIR